MNFWTILKTINLAKNANTYFKVQRMSLIFVNIYTYEN